MKHETLVCIDVDDVLDDLEQRPDFEKAWGKLDGPDKEHLRQDWIRLGVAMKDSFTPETFVDALVNHLQHHPTLGDVYTLSAHAMQVLVRDRWIDICKANQ